MDQVQAKIQALATSFTTFAQGVLPWIVVPGVLLVGLAWSISPAFRKFATQYQGWFYGVLGGILLVMWGPDLIPSIITWLQ